MIETPFENIESAHHYVTLLAEQVCQIKAEILEDAALAGREGESRRVDVLRLVDYKLNQLANQLTTSARVLNDLRTLRRLLLGERESTRENGADEPNARDTAHSS